MPTGATANVVPCKPAKQVYRGKYVDQIADTPIGAIRLRNWDRTHGGRSTSTRSAGGPEDCVVLPQ